MFASVERVDAAENDRSWLERARPLGSGAPRLGDANVRTLTARPAGAHRPAHRSGRGGHPGRLGLRLAARRRAPSRSRSPTAGYRAGGKASRPLPRSTSNLTAAARFYGDGDPVRRPRCPGRRGRLGRRRGSWPPASPAPVRTASSGATAADYQEGAPGEYLANAIAAGEAGLAKAFSTRARTGAKRRRFRVGLDSAAAWAVRPFPATSALPLRSGETAASLPRHDESAPFGIDARRPRPGAGTDPWTGSHRLERLEPRRARRAPRRPSTSSPPSAAPPPPPAPLPERVDARTGIPRSTIPASLVPRLRDPRAARVLAPEGPKDRHR